MYVQNVCTHMHVHVMYINESMYTYVCTRMHVHVYTYAGMYVCTYARMYVCTYVRMYVYMYIYIYIHTFVARYAFLIPDLSFLIRIVHAPTSMLFHVTMRMSSQQSLTSILQPLVNC